MEAAVTYRRSIVLALPAGVVAGAIVGLSVAASALVSGSDFSGLYFVGIGALVGLLAAAVGLLGGTVAALVFRGPQQSRKAQRLAIVLTAGIAVLLVTFLVGVVVLGYGGQAGGTYIWTIGAFALAIATWACAALLTSTRVTSRSRGSRETTIQET